MRAAVFTAAPRLFMKSSSDSTSRIRHFGQVAETTSRSSEVSAIQPAASPVGIDGYAPAWPDWLTFLKQPLAVVHGGRPYIAR